jgi:hypothetical protein
LRNFGPRKELPPLSNATELFKERIEALLKSVELLGHMEESLHGRHFVRQDVETAAVLISPELLSEKGREAIREQHGLDLGEDLLVPDAVAILPGGVALSPSETGAMLIGVYALAGGDVDKTTRLAAPRLILRTCRNSGRDKTVHRRVQSRCRQKRRPKTLGPPACHLGTW